VRLRELALALTILGAIAAVAVPHRFRANRAAGEAAAIQALEAIVKAEAVYRESEGGSRRYCQDLAALGAGQGRAGLPPLGLLAGYRFGSIETDENAAPLAPERRFAYYAVPEIYGVKGMRTLIVDSAGRIFAKDTGRSAPPPAWPASDPTAAGWTILGQ